MQIINTFQRFKSLQAWFEEELCNDREFKTSSSENPHVVTEIVKQKPRCFIGYIPTNLTEFNSAPCIVLMLNPSKARDSVEQRFDRYNNIHRPKELGQKLYVTALFVVYDPGVRDPGFAESAQANQPNMELFHDGTESGLQTLFDWMDDAKAKLLGARTIPDSDLAITDETVEYGQYTDQNYVVDKRPLYYGYMNMEFICHADRTTPNFIDDMLRGGNINA